MAKYEKTVNKNFNEIKSNLEELGYKVSCFDTKEEATEYIKNEVKEKTVGFGASVTLQQMGLYEKLSENNRVVWHWKIPMGKSEFDVRNDARATEIYISSVNGIAETGEIINIDGTGNRVAETQFGHKKVYLIAGENKIAPDYDEALYRARNIAAPLNAKRLGRKTPCAANADKCYNCKSPERICRALSVFWCKPYSCEYEVILIHENLGY